MFDSKKEFEVPVLSGEEKRCVLRWPTDQEWHERTRKQRSVRHSLGRGKSKFEVLNAAECDFELFEKIRQDADGVSFDEAEASRAISRIERCMVRGVERTGNQYRIELKVPGGTVASVLKMPTQKQLMEYSRASLSMIDGRRHSEWRVSWEPAGRLYDELHVSHEGYADGVAVPIVHKETTIRELVEQVDQDPEDDDDPE